MSGCEPPERIQRLKLPGERGVSPLPTEARAVYSVPLMPAETLSYGKKR
jgi:hypothetical protein